MRRMQTRHFAYSEADGVATVRLDRPERLNALTFDSYRELADTFAALATRDSVRAVVVTGTGRAFCSGGDVVDIIGKLLDASEAELAAFTRMTCELVENIHDLEKPVIASLNGTVCGAGAVIACACDLRLAAESAKIAFLFTKVGLCGADMGAAWLLPRIVGLGHAKELLLGGEFISAGRAAEIGLYNRVVPSDELAALTAEWAERLARGPSMGLAMTKRMLAREAHTDFATAMQLEAWAQAECMQHPDHGESHQAFVDKRPANFVQHWPGHSPSEAGECSND
ncbi:MAG: enoyl-CoA hydratase [Planctomycetes bacterium]|nr:enoyl-CoA hydratase [Planctomycetota bacterium]